jgi:hypothetical protein
MDTLVKGITDLKLREKIRDDDTVDQLHHFVTVYILAAFALFVGVREYTVGQLDCWVTNYNFKHFQDHANQYCWTHKLYRYPNPNNLSEVQLSLLLPMHLPFIIFYL